MENVYKEVRFDKYCSSCEHEDVNEAEDPCNKCLTNPVNEYSQKPVNWSEKE